MRILFYISVFWLLFSGFLAAPAYAFETRAREAIAVDYDTGVVLFAKEADAKTYPASMTKMMTAYIAFQRLAAGDITMDDRFSVSEKAWRMQGSKMFVELNNRIRVEDLLRGIIIQSGNDACVVMAEGLGGSEEQFAAMMNETAGKLGMTGSHFVNSDGWPHEDHYTTARDLAMIARHLIADFPQYYPLWAEPDYTYHNITQQNRNLLLHRDIGVDGLKTGHTEISGYGMTVSGKDADGRRVIAVVHGLTGEKERADAAAELYQYALSGFDNTTVIKAGAILGEAKTWYGERPAVPLTVAADHAVTLPKLGRDKTEFVLIYPAPLSAPVPQGAAVGELVIHAPGLSEQRVPVVTAEAVARAGVMDRARMNVEMILNGE